MRWAPRSPHGIPLARLLYFLLLLGGCCWALLATSVDALSAADGAAIGAISHRANSIAMHPVRFAASALDPPPSDALAVDPADWPPLAPNCTAAYLDNQSIVSTAGAPVTVRIAVHAGSAVSLHGCTTAHSSPLWNVRLVLAMGRSSAVALDAWDVDVGGITIEGTDPGSPPVDALVVVHGGSRIVAGTGGDGSSTRASSTIVDPTQDVHALSVVTGMPFAAVSGVGIAILERSVVRAQHDGRAALFASVCAVRAEAAPSGEDSNVDQPPTLNLTRFRVIVAHQSRLEATAKHSLSAGYERTQARRAHAATLQVLTAARVSASFVEVAIVSGSTVTVFGDDGSAAAGIGLSARKRGDAGVAYRTVVELTSFKAIAAGGGTSVKVETVGQGYGTAAMGIATYFNAAAVTAKNVTWAILGPNTTVQVIVGGSGGGTAALGVAAYEASSVAVSGATICALGSSVSVSVRVVTGGASATAALGVGAFRDGAKATLDDAVVYVGGPDASVLVDIANGGGGAAAMGLAVHAATVSAARTRFVAVGPRTRVTMEIASGAGDGASSLGVGRSSSGMMALQSVSFVQCEAGVNATRRGAVDIAVWDSSAAEAPGVTFSSNSSGSDCDVPFSLPRRSTRTKTGTPSSSATALRTKATEEPHAVTSSATVTVSAAAAAAAAKLSGSASLSLSRPRGTVAGIQDVTSTASLPPRPNAPSSAWTRTVAVSPVPTAASTAASIVSGVLLPPTASKPVANARVLQLADACLAVGGDVDGGALAAEPGDWPSDFAVVVARWQIGPGKPGSAEAAAGRGAGAAVAVGLAMAAGAAVCLWLAFRNHRNSGAAAAAENTNPKVDSPRSAAQSSSVSSTPAVAAIVSATYLAPSGLEAAVVAAFAAGAGSLSAMAGIAGMLVMVVATVPGFAVPLLHRAPPSATASNAALRAVVAFVHPVIIDGLVDEARPLHRAHALADFATALVVAAASGITQAGVRPFGSCVAAALTMAIAASLLTGYYALVRPFAARVEVAVGAVQAGTLMTLCWLTVAVVWHGNSDGPSTTTSSSVSPNTLATAGMAAEAATFGAPVVLLAAAVWDHYAGGRSTSASSAAAADGASSDAPLLWLASREALARRHSGTHDEDQRPIVTPPAPRATTSKFQRNPLSRQGDDHRRGRGDEAASAEEL